MKNIFIFIFALAVSISGSVFGSSVSVNAQTGAANSCRSLFPVGAISEPMIRPEDGRCLIQISSAVCNDGRSYRTGSYEIQAIPGSTNCIVMAPNPAGNTPRSQAQGSAGSATGAAAKCNSIFPSGVLEGPIIRPEDGRCLVQISKTVCDDGTSYRTGDYQIERLSSGNCYVYSPKTASSNNTNNTQTGACPDGQGNPGNGCVPCGRLTGNDGKTMLYGEAVRTCVSNTDCASNPNVFISGGRCVNKTGSQNTGNPSANTNTGPGNPNLNFEISADQARLTNLMWAGKTIEYNPVSKAVVNKPAADDDKQYTQRACGDASGIVLNINCQRVVNEAKGAQIYAFRYRVQVPLKGVVNNPQDYLRAQKLNENANGMMFRQVLYTYSTGNNTYKPWFFYDQDGNRIELSQDGKNIKYIVTEI